MLTVRLPLGRGGDIVIPALICTTAATGLAALFGLEVNES